MLKRRGRPALWENLNTEVLYLRVPLPLHDFIVSFARRVGVTISAAFRRWIDFEKELVRIEANWNHERRLGLNPTTVWIYPPIRIANQPARITAALAKIKVRLEDGRLVDVTFDENDLGNLWVDEIPVMFDGKEAIMRNPVSTPATGRFGQ